MNPLILFDYFYYRLVYFYENSFRLIISKEIEGLAGLTLFQFFNVISILNFIKPLNRSKSDLLYIVIIVSVIIVVFNIIRYNKVISYSKLAAKWDNEPRKPRLLKKYVIICYCILSMVLLVFSIIKTQKI